MSGFWKKLKRNRILSVRVVKNLKLCTPWLVFLRPQIAIFLTGHIKAKWDIPEGSRCPVKECSDPCIANPSRCAKP